MKKSIMATAITACIALCAAVWPQNRAPEETPIPPPTPAVCAAESNVAELKMEVQIAPPTEEEKEAVLPTEAPTEIPVEPDPSPAETPAAPLAQPTPEPEMPPEAAPEPAPQPTPEPPTAQKPTEPQIGDMIYVPGFGWIENQGPNRVEFAADMYENGNKIGIMG